LQEHIIGEMRADIPSLFREQEKPPYEEIREDIEVLKKIREEILSIDVENTAPVEVSLKLKKIQEQMGKNGEG